jgi:hypothetical protein
MSVQVLQPSFPVRFNDINTDNIERRLTIKLPELTCEEIKELIIEYKKFLLLFSLYKDENYLLAPGHLVDEVWHEHILHSKQYYEDCIKIFDGVILHHFPSANEEGESLSDTYMLYEKTFNTKPPEKFWLNRLLSGSNAPCCGNGGGTTGCRGGNCSPGK